MSRPKKASKGSDPLAQRKQAAAAKERTLAMLRGEDPDADPGPTASDPWADVNWARMAQGIAAVGMASAQLSRTLLTAATSPGSRCDVCACEPASEPRAGGQ